jgi:hypothetical protein
MEAKFDLSVAQNRGQPRTSATSTTGPPSLLCCFST